MAASGRTLGLRGSFQLAVRGTLQQLPHQTSSRLSHSALRTVVHLHTTAENTSQDGREDDTSTRERAIKAREPSYAGWWTEVMNYHTTPQTSIDPGAPIPGKVTATPSAEDIKKGYGNTLPGAKTTTENTLPTATSLGSTLSAPAAESFDYNGFAVPVKPSPPGAEDCCMSGCAHCIYDIYEEDRQEYKARLAKILDEISKAGLPPPPNIRSKKGGDDGASAQSTNDEDDDMDPGMKAFLELERKLKGS